MNRLADSRSTPSSLDAAQGANEERTETYLYTSKEYRSWQRSDAPRATGAAGLTGWQGGGSKGVA